MLLFEPHKGAAKKLKALKGAVNQKRLKNTALENLITFRQFNLFT